MISAITAGCKTMVEARICGGADVVRAETLKIAAAAAGSGCRADCPEAAGAGYAVPAVAVSD